MKNSDIRRDAGLRIIETSRLLRSLVEQRLKPYGMTRAQYATLARLDRQCAARAPLFAPERERAALVALVDECLASFGPRHGVATA